MLSNWQRTNDAGGACVLYTPHWRSRETETWADSGEGLRFEEGSYPPSCTDHVWH